MQIVGAGLHERSRRGLEDRTARYAYSTGSGRTRLPRFHPGEQAPVEHPEVVGLQPDRARPDPIGAGRQRAHVGHRGADGIDLEREGPSGAKTSS